jgi:hypothetical protein
MIALGRHLILALALLWAGPALAEVRIHFHSFNGSMFFGRYPHTFIVLEGTLEENGKAVSENYGFSARTVTTAVLSGPVEHMVMVEKPEHVRKTNRHFTLTLTDQQYHRIVAEVRAWQNAPGRYYDLENRNCIHFVGRMAELLGLKVEYPAKMLRRPKQWLNHIIGLNPKLGVKPIK